MTLPMNYVKKLFEDKLIEDDRIPNLTLRGDTFELQIVAPRLLFFIQIGLVSFANNPTI
jgi:hypothetical protein